MTSDLQCIIESKRAWRRSLAQRPVAEKLALLDELRDRARDPGSDHVAGSGGIAGAPRNIASSPGRTDHTQG